MLAGRDAGAQRGGVVLRDHGKHRLVGGGGGGESCDAVPGDRLQQGLRRGLLDGDRGAAEAPGEDERHAEAKGEGDRRRTGPAVAGAGPEDVTGEAVGGGEDVAVIVDAPLGLAGGARGEGDHRHVVPVGVGGGKAGLDPLQPRFEGAAAHVAAIGEEGADEAGLVGGGAEIVEAAFIDDGVVDLRARDQGGEFAGAEQGHGGDEDAAGLEDAEPGGEQHRSVRAAQQDAIAGHKPLLLDEQAGDAVGEDAHVAVRPCAGVVDEGEGVGGRSVDQLDRGVESFRVAKLRQVEEEFGLRLGRRQAVPNEAIAVRGAHHSGTTAVASISMRAAGSTRPVTPTTAMAG